MNIGKDILFSLLGSKKDATFTGLYGNKVMTVEHLIVGATGLGYLIVGILQWSKGELSNGMIWTGYAFAQVGLWMNLR